MRLPSGSRSPRTENGTRGIRAIDGSLINHPLADFSVAADTAITEEGPDAAHVFEGFEVAVGEQNVLVSHGRPLDDLTVKIGDKALPQNSISPSVPVRLTVAT